MSTPRKTPRTDRLRSRIPDPRAVQDMIASHSTLEVETQELAEALEELVKTFGVIKSRANAALARHRANQEGSK